MRKFKLNFGVVIAAVVLLAYAYISFMGMLYKWDGVIWKAALVAFGVIALVSVCVFIMVNAKITKSKETGLIFQIVFGVVICAVFFLCGIPFTSFYKVVQENEKITAKIDSVCICTAKLDTAYNKYVMQRVSDYRNSLPEGNDLKVLSFQHRLSPDPLRECQERRKNWLEENKDMSIWNIKLPANLNTMDSCVKVWTDNYRDLSAIAYDSMEMKNFEYSESYTSISNLRRELKGPGFSPWAILAALLASIAMMIPFWLAIPTHTRKVGPIQWRPQIGH